MLDHLPDMYQLGPHIVHIQALKLWKITAFVIMFVLFYRSRHGTGYVHNDKKINV